MFRKQQLPRSVMLREDDTINIREFTRRGLERVRTRIRQAEDTQADL
jgi:hypothetical protein